METICMKYQILFSGKNKKKISLINLSAEFVHRLVKVKQIMIRQNVPSVLNLDITDEYGILRYKTTSVFRKYRGYRNGN